MKDEETSHAVPLARLNLIFNKASEDDDFKEALQNAYGSDYPLVQIKEALGTYLNISGPEADEILEAIQSLDPGPLEATLWV